MTQLASAVWLPSLLLVLLFCLPGCVPLSGPRIVTGTVGESLSVKCQYEEEFKTNDKYWCRESQVLRLCSTSVTTRSSKEARNSRMSIRDHPDNLTFTVTLENLTMEDAGTYLCAVHIRFTISDFLPIDKYFRVVVSVVPGSIPGNSTNTLGSPTTSPVHTQSSVTTEDTIPGSSLQPRSLLSSLSFQILVFLKLPLLLSMLSAVLWVNRPLRCSGKKQHWPD